ncbi:hypothetical protein [Thermogutta sp.]|uniref:hypothetical protein n=1 Tax=Thermogutta sp. TaxID=1962930 RepID=UPI003C7E9D45
MLSRMIASMMCSELKLGMIPRRTKNGSSQSSIWAIKSPRNRIVKTAIFITALTLLLLFGLGRAVCADSGFQQPEVEIELAVDPRLPPFTQQEWARELSRLGVTRVRIRTAFPSDHPNVEVLPTSPQPTYHVIGIVNNSNELVVPGARFSIRQLSGFVRWIDDLRTSGPPQSRPKTVAFGLDMVRFQLVKQDLAQPVAISTLARDSREIVDQLLAKLHNPVVWDERAKSRLSSHEIGEELKTLATGTVLAYLLRYDGLALVPRGDVQGIKYRIVRGGPNVACWPVGWSPEEGESKAVPQLLEFLNVNIQNVNIRTVLASIESRLGLVALFDYPAMVRYGIDLEKTSISIPQTKTTYSQVISRSLFQAKLKGEVRVDDAGKPFLWITTLRPIED